MRKDIDAMKVLIRNIPSSLWPKARCRCNAVASFEIQVDEGELAAGFNLCSVCHRQLTSGLDGSLSDIGSVNRWLRSADPVGYDEYLLRR